MPKMLRTMLLSLTAIGGTAATADSNLESHDIADGNPMPYCTSKDDSRVAYAFTPENQATADAYKSRMPITGPVGTNVEGEALSIALMFNKTGDGVAFGSMHSGYDQAEVRLTAMRFCEGQKP